MQIDIARQLDELHISKYVADPRKAIAAELKKREALAATPPGAA